MSNYFMILLWNLSNSKTIICLCSDHNIEKKNSSKHFIYTHYKFEKLILSYSYEKNENKELSVISIKFRMEML